jgi:DNA-binding protein H-NS
MPFLREVNMATLEQIQARVKKLQAQAEALIAKRAQGALDQIRELMIKHGLTTRDIEARAKARRERAQAQRTRAAGVKLKAAGPVKGKLAPKYRDPETGATWSGHARPPAWIKNVKDRSRFLIDAGSATLATTASAPAKKTAAKHAVGRKAASAKAAGSVVAKKATASTAGALKVTAKKAVAKKAAAKKTTAKTTLAKRATPAAVEKAAAKKTPGRKPTVKNTARALKRAEPVQAVESAAPAEASAVTTSQAT